MTTKKENQSQNQPKDKMLKNSPDIIFLSQFYEDLAKACVTLDKIFYNLNINIEQMRKVRRSFGSSPEVWDLKQAKEFLDMIILNAALGNTQFLEKDELLVQVTSIKQ